MKFSFNKIAVLIVHELVFTLHLNLKEEEESLWFSLLKFMYRCFL